MNKVMPGLFIGNFRDAKDSEQLKTNNITHIVAIHDNPKPAIEEIKYKCVDLSDSPAADIGKYFSDCTMFIHNARKNGGNVLVHCVAGVSRSCAICAAYIIAIAQIKWSDAILVVRAARDVVNPNYGFQKHLENFDIVDAKNVRKKLVEAFGEIDGADIDFIKEVIEKLTEASDGKSDLNTLGTTGTFASYQCKKNGH